MNHNEEFKRTLMIKMIDNININYANQQIIERVLVELLQDYTIIKNETSPRKSLDFFLLLRYNDYNV